MFFNHIGEFSALVVAIVWTITALAFEYSAFRVGSLNVNLLRLPLGFFFLSVFTFFTRGYILPVDASFNQWFWLLLSGFVGFVIGDLFLLKSFVLIGSRFSMLIMTLVPPITTILGWLILNEKLLTHGFIGMILTVTGILIAIISHKDENTKKFSFKSTKGIFYAVGGAIGQSTGLILSKIGMGNYNAFAASQIRIIAGIFGFLCLIFLLGRIKLIVPAIRNREGMKGILIGSFFGPFVGVSLSLFSIQHAQNTGVASTIMAIVPILIIPPSIFLFKQKITRAEIIGTLLSVIGVALFFI
jgi:drug/metabolite transporter (DMT)-like permease